MELYVQVIFTLAILKYGLNSALTNNLAAMIGYALLAATFSMLLYPLVITQPVTIIEQLLSNKTMVTNVAVITTIEAIAGIFAAITLANNLYMSNNGHKGINILLKVTPGVLFFMAIAYFELLFFKWRVGSDFLISAVLYSSILCLTLLVASFLIRRMVASEHLKLELKMLLNLGILLLGLIINSTVADYNLSYANMVIEWGALATFMSITIISFAIGLFFNKHGQKIKKLVKRH